MNREPDLRVVNRTLSAVVQKQEIKALRAEIAQPTRDLNNNMGRTA